MEHVCGPHRSLADDGLDPEIALQTVRDEAMLGGDARLNLATFVSTGMEPLAVDLYAAAVDRDLVDRDEPRA